MAIYTYTGTLADLGGAPFPEAIPRLWVVAERDTFGPDGPIPAAKKVEITVASSGAFSVQLHDSASLSPPTRYRLRCLWLDGDSGDPVGFAEWVFTAFPGGGPINEGGEPPTYSVWIGPPWPAAGTPGLYIDRNSPNEWGII